MGKPRRLFRESLHLYQALGDRRGEAEAQFFLAFARHAQALGDDRAW